MQNFDQIVDPIEVICSFVKSNLIKDEISLDDSTDDLVKKFEIQKSKIDHLTLDQLYTLLPTEMWRFELYQKHSWVFKSIELKYLAPWYATGDLPEEWCSMSVVDVASKIKCNPNVDSDSIRRIKVISRYPDIITSYFPPIVYQGGEIRKDLSLQVLPVDSDDGSHRSIAAALSGKTHIPGYVGFVKVN